MSATAAQTSAPRPAAWELPAAVRPPVDADAVRRRLVDYVLLRATGVVLSVLVLGHFAVTHVVNDVANDDSAFVARRLSSALWIAWDSTMLAAALAHGAVGVRFALADYSSGRRRRILRRTFLVVPAVLFVLGAIAIAKAAHV
jgi:succinate dehydrogenase / fumarate reductase membrane anchor subunit